MVGRRAVWLTAASFSDDPRVPALPLRAALRDLVTRHATVTRGGIVLRADYAIVFARRPPM
jgi:hypothetical protein